MIQTYFTNNKDDEEDDDNLLDDEQNLPMYKLLNNGGYIKKGRRKCIKYFVIFILSKIVKIITQKVCQQL